MLVLYSSTRMSFWDFLSTSGDFRWKRRYINLRFHHSKISTLKFASQMLIVNISVDSNDDILIF